MRGSLVAKEVPVVVGLGGVSIVIVAIVVVV
jgi:hypothetical protein